MATRAGRQVSDYALYIGSTVGFVGAGVDAVPAALLGGAVQGAGFDDVGGLSHRCNPPRRRSFCLGRGRGGCGAG